MTLEADLEGVMSGTDAEPPPPTPRQEIHTSEEEARKAEAEAKAKVKAAKEITAQAKAAAADLAHKAKEARALANKAQVDLRAAVHGTGNVKGKNKEKRDPAAKARAKALAVKCAAAAKEGCQAAEEAEEVASASGGDGDKSTARDKANSTAAHGDTPTARVGKDKAGAEARPKVGKDKKRAGAQAPALQKRVNNALTNMKRGTARNTDAEETKTSTRTWKKGTLKEDDNKKPKDEKPKSGKSASAKAKAHAARCKQRKEAARQAGTGLKPRRQAPSSPPPSKGRQSPSSPLPSAKASKPLKSVLKKPSKTESDTASDPEVFAEDSEVEEVFAEDPKVAKRLEKALKETDSKKWTVAHRRAALMRFLRSRQPNKSGRKPRVATIPEEMKKELEKDMWVGCAEDWGICQIFYKKSMKHSKTKEVKQC